MPGGCRRTIQWTSAVFFIAAIAGLLFTNSLARLSSPQVAKPVLREVFKESLVQSEFGRGFDEIQERLKEFAADKPLTVPGFPGIIITAGEAAKLEREELADYLSARVVSTLYKGQTGGTTDPTGMDALSVNPLAAVFSAPAHGTILRFRSIALAQVIFWGALMLIFGRRFGRPFGLGVGLSVGALVPLAAYTMIMNRFDETIEIAPIPGVESIVSAPVISSFQEIARSSRVEAFAVMIIGMILILVSIIGRLVIGSSGRR